MRSRATDAKLSQRMHQHYLQRAEGDGAETVFPLAHAPSTKHGLMVFADGILQAPPAYDHDLRTGVVTFAIAPGAGVALCFATVSV